MRLSLKFNVYVAVFILLDLWLRRLLLYRLLRLNSLLTGRLTDLRLYRLLHMLTRLPPCRLCIEYRIGSRCIESRSVVLS